MQVAVPRESASAAIADSPLIVIRSRLSVMASGHPFRVAGRTSTSGPLLVRVLVAILAVALGERAPCGACAEGDASHKVGTRVLLIGQGPDGHPPATHEYRAGVRVLASILQLQPELEVEVLSADGSWEEGPAKLREADAAVLFLSQGAKWIHEEPRRLEALAQLAARGGGLIALHWAMGTREPQYIDGFLKLFGGCHGGPDRKYKVLETRLEVADPSHPVAAGLRGLRVHEEFYYQLKFINDRGLKPVLKAEIDGQWETVAWAWERADGGRSFGFSGCHFHANWREEDYRRLLANAVLWTLKRPIPPRGSPAAVRDADLLLSP